MIAKSWQEAGIDVLQIPAGVQSGRLTCPQCSHTRKKSKEKCLSVDLVDSLWYCHHCGWKGAVKSNWRGDDWNGGAWEAAHDAWRREIKAALIEFDGDDAPPMRGDVITNAFMSINELVALEIPEPEYLLYPWLSYGKSAGSLTMLYSWRGAGKSLLAWEIIAATASGEGFMCWPATPPYKLDPEDGRPVEAVPKKVLVLDGELPNKKLQNRVTLLQKGRQGRENIGDFIRIITRDNMVAERQAHINIADALDQEIINAEIERWNPALIVIDNLSTLARSMHSENDAESWHVIQDWLYDLRSKGIAVLILHHAGKGGGGQRGTSTREDALDTVIKLVQRGDAEFDAGTEGTEFDLLWEKTRDFNADDLIVRCTISDASMHGKCITSWDHENKTNRLDIEIRELHAEGKSQRAIAAILGVHQSTVHRRLKKMKLI